MNLICFSHLRWNFVYQRPQHLLSRFAELFNVLYVEEPVYGAETAYLKISQAPENVTVLVPQLPDNLTQEEIKEQQNRVLCHYLTNQRITDFVAWFYTPMSLSYLDALPEPSLIVYDCMDELSAFKNAPTEIAALEKELIQKADLVFTGGQSLYKAKQHLHPHIYPFPSSIDKEHFGLARLGETIEPPDQSGIEGVKIGFFGVIDERFDIALLDAISQLRPDYNFILIGPVVKIDPASLPQRSNIHYLGSKSYKELPAYLKGWDVAMIPFARNESTQFISPTKTPEYLAGGTPVVSTSIADVVDPYGDNGLVCIADEPEAFVKGIEWAIDIRHNKGWNIAVNDFLKELSWDKTWDKMLLAINTRQELKQRTITNKKGKVHV